MWSQCTAKTGNHWYNSRIPSFLLWASAAKEPRGMGSISIFSPSFLPTSESAVTLNLPPGIMNAYSVSSLLVAVWSLTSLGLSIICQMETVRPSSKNYLGLYIWNMCMCQICHPKHPSQVRELSLYAAPLVGPGDIQQHEVERMFREVSCSKHQR